MEGMTNVKKTLISLLLVVMLVLALAVPAVADEAPVVNTPELLASAIAKKAGNSSQFVQLTGVIAGEDKELVLNARYRLCR